MANTNALVGLVNGVRTYFAANGIIASVPPVGWRQRSEQINQSTGGASRVVFVPGDEQGHAGSLHRGRSNTDNPRALLEWDMIATAYIWGVDTTGINDEQKQVEATNTLFENVVRGVHYSVDPNTGTVMGTAQVLWGDVRWNIDNTEQYFGRELIVGLTLKTSLLDPVTSTTTPKAAMIRGPFL